MRGIDISIAAGETAALLGPNGAGKATTIDMLLGLAKPDGGTVSVFGRAPRDAVDRDVSSGFSSVDGEARGAARLTIHNRTPTRCPPRARGRLTA